MSTFEKRAREGKRAQKARGKAQRREERRNAPPSTASEFITVEEIVGNNVRSIEEVMQSLQAGNQGQRSAPTLPVKLFVGSLSSETTSADLQAHFEPHGRVLEAAVIMDRNTGASRNFGFVTLADRKDGPAVIAALHQSELDGHNIVVNVATESR